MAAGRGRQISEFEDNLAYRATSRTARDTQGNRLEKNKKRKKQSLKLSSISNLIFTFRNYVFQQKKFTQYTVRGSRLGSNRHTDCQNYILNISLLILEHLLMTGHFRRPINPIKFECQLIFIPGSIPGSQNVSSPNLFQLKEILEVGCWFVCFFFQYNYNQLAPTVVHTY